MKKKRDWAAMAFFSAMGLGITATVCFMGYIMLKAME